MTLFPARPTTPIAAELQDHFDRGGTVAEGVRLVELLERGARTVTITKAQAARGSRLATDWQPSQSEVAFALDRGMSQSRVDTEAEKFRNYWTAKSGAGATKRDWCATWRNWIITAMERGNGPPSYRGQGPGTSNPPGRGPTGSAAIIAGMGKLARRIDERRVSAGQDGANATGTLDLEPRRAR